MRTTTRSSSSSTGKGSEQSHFKGRLQGWKHKSCNNTDSVLHNDYHEALLTTTQCGRLGVVANGSLFLLMRWHRWGCPCLSACLNRWMNERLPTHIIRTDYVIIPSAIQFPFTTIAHILFSDQSCSTNLHRTTYLQWWKKRGRVNSRPKTHIGTCLRSDGVQRRTEEADEVKWINHPFHWIVWIILNTWSRMRTN